MTATPMSRHTRQVLAVGHGLGQADTDPAIARSWRRCLEQHRLDPSTATSPSVLEHPRILEQRERSQRVLEIAHGEMNRLHQQLAGAGHAVLLTDASGLILDCITHEAERDTFQRAGLWLGADWSESCEGTNGIGTCAVERHALTIHQDEHFRNRHTILTCSASPVFDPAGDLLAVLDVSSARRTVSRQSQFHTMALVNLSAKLIESCYFLRQCEDSYLLRFHTQPDYVGLLSEGLLAFDESGRISAINESALNLLGTTRPALLGQPVETLIELPLASLLDRAQPHPTHCWPLYSTEGTRFYGQLRAPHKLVQSVPVRTPPRPALCLEDPALAREFERARKVMERDVPVLLTGETGTGKEAFAKALHLAGSRASKPFIALNCAAIPESLIESELFGYAGGTFTGARKEGMRGKLLEAHGGTLFLDEIGDMPLMLQTRLLRVLEERQVVPLGGQPQAIDVRIISATHRDLRIRVGDGSFREDLYYRLNGLVVSLPPVRERLDKAALLNHLLLEEAQGQSLHLDAEARQALLGYQWPGNVRQLRNVLRTLVALCEDGVIRRGDLPQEISSPTSLSALTLDAPLEDAEKTALLQILEQEHWQMTRTAERLGISRNTLYRKLHKHGITPRR
ncbi:sigma-54-dependent Fis family transcriptional regulator [Pseudomonas luteola]